MTDVYHALGLNMHVPLGNLIALHNSEELPKYQYKTQLLRKLYE